MQVTLLPTEQPGYLPRPRRIAELQSELAKVQRMFLWNQGVFAAMIDELTQHRGRDVTLK